MITGLCSGIAKWLNVDVTMVRIVTVITAIFAQGVPVLLIYIIASLVIPKEPDYNATYGDGFGGGPFGNRNQRPFSGGFQTSNRGYSTYETTGSVPNPPPPPSPGTDELDEMMKEVEKKALQKEIEELRAKLNKFEKGDV